MSDSNRVKVSVIDTDATGAIVPTVDNYAKRVRTTNEGLSWSKAVTPSNEIQPNRNVQDLVDIGAQGSGTLAFELHPPRLGSDAGTFFGSLMCSSWTVLRNPIISTSSITYQLNADGSVYLSHKGSPLYGAERVVYITSSVPQIAGTWVLSSNNEHNTAIKGTRPVGYNVDDRTFSQEPVSFANGEKVEPCGELLPLGAVSIIIKKNGDFVEVSFPINNKLPGYNYINTSDMWFALHDMKNPGNNGFYHVASYDKNNVLYCDVYPAGQVDENQNTSGVIFIPLHMKNGTSENYFTISVTDYADDGSFFSKYYKALRVGQTQLSFDTSSIVTGTHTLMGKDHKLTNDEGMSDTRLKDRSMSARANVVNLLQNYSPMAGMASAKTLTLNINNNLRAQPGIGSYGLVGIGAGTFEVTGSMSAYFQNSSLYNAFINNDHIRLDWVIGIDNSYLGFSLPKCRISSAQNSAKGLNQDLTDDINFQAIEADSGEYTMMLFYFPYFGSLGRPF